MRKLIFLLFIPILLFGQIRWDTTMGFKTYDGKGGLVRVDVRDCNRDGSVTAELQLAVNAFSGKRGYVVFAESAKALSVAIPSNITLDGLGTGKLIHPTGNGAGTILSTAIITTGGSMVRGTNILTLTTPSSVAMENILVEVYGASSPNGYQYAILTGDMTASENITANVDTTGGFPTSGVLQVGSEFMTYTSKTISSFSVTSRGNYGTIATTHTTGDTVFFWASLLSHVVGVNGATLTLADTASKTVSNVIVLLGTANITIKNLTIDGLSPYENVAANGVDIQVTRSNHFLIENVETWRGEHGNIMITGSQNGTVTQCRFYEAGHHYPVTMGSSLWLFSQSCYNKITSNFFGGDTLGASITLDDRTVAAGRLDGGSNYNIISGNTIISNKAIKTYWSSGVYGINVESSSFNRVEKNTIVNTYYGILFSYPAQGRVARQHYGNVVSENTVLNTVYGYYINSGVGNIVTNNVAQGCIYPTKFTRGLIPWASNRYYNNGIVDSTFRVTNDQFVVGSGFSVDSGVVNTFIVRAESISTQGLITNEISTNKLVAGTGTNVVTNPSFENGTINWATSAGLYKIVPSGGVTATATSTLDEAGSLSSVNIVDSGIYYSSSPATVIEAVGEIPSAEASGYAVIQNGKVVQFVIVDAGKGYDSATILIDAPSMPTSLSHSGDSSAHIEYNFGNGSLRQGIHVDSLTNYFVSAWVMRPTGGRSARILVRGVHPTPAAYILSYYPPTTANNWTKINKLFNTGLYDSVVICLDLSGATNGGAFFDEISFSKTVGLIVNGDSIEIFGSVKGSVVIRDSAVFSGTDTTVTVICSGVKSSDVVVVTATGTVILTEGDKFRVVYGTNEFYIRRGAGGISGLKVNWIRIR